MALVLDVPLPNKNADLYHSVYFQIYAIYIIAQNHVKFAHQLAKTFSLLKSIEIFFIQIFSYHLTPC